MKRKNFVNRLLKSTLLMSFQINLIKSFSQEFGEPKMPDINALLFQLIDEKGFLHVAGLLKHDSTKILERWKKDGQIPELRKFQVLEMLKSEGVIK